jgi:hypothetical protein
MRMLSPDDNPQARNLFEIVAYLQKYEGTVLEVHVTIAGARRKTAIFVAS